MSKDTLQPIETAQDIQLDTYTLREAHFGLDAWKSLKVTGSVNGEEVTFYDFYQTRYSGEGMSTSVTKTERAQISQMGRNFEKELIEFAHLQKDFKKIRPKAIREQMSQVSAQSDITNLMDTLDTFGFNYHRFCPIMHSIIDEKIFNQVDDKGFITLDSMELVVVR